MKALLVLSMTLWCALGMLHVNQTCTFAQGIESRLWADDPNDPNEPGTERLALWSDDDPNDPNEPGTESLARNQEARQRDPTHHAEKEAFQRGQPQLVLHQQGGPSEGCELPVAQVREDQAFEQQFADGDQQQALTQWKPDVGHDV